MQPSTVQLERPAFGREKDETSQTVLLLFFNDPLQVRSGLISEHLLKGPHGLLDVIQQVSRGCLELVSVVGSCNPIDPLQTA